MDQLAALRIFQAVAEHRSFAAAARQLRISPSTATRALADLEGHVGAPLMRHSTRAVSLTDAGRDYLATCRRLLAELDEADRLAGGEAVRPRGLLVITAPVQFGRMHVAPIRDESGRWPMRTARSSPSSIRFMGRSIS
jgi:DNA-binding transcriptional LysR family regulator